MNRLQQNIIVVLLVIFVLNIAIVTRWCFQNISGSYECQCSLQRIGSGGSSRMALLKDRLVDSLAAVTGGKQPPSAAEIGAALKQLAQIDARVSKNSFRTLQDVLPSNAVLPIDRNSLYWKFCMQMHSGGLYSEDQEQKLLQNLLLSMSQATIRALATEEKGTQLKFIVDTYDGSKSIVKMMKTKRDYEVPADLFYFSEIEKHNAEIAAYHLDKILGWRRVPPCIGRVLNISSEMEPFFDDSFKKTVYTSPAGNRCFHGHCKYYCETAHSVCGDPLTVEASFCVLLPYDIFTRTLEKNPWRRSYSKRGAADWQIAANNATFCANLLKSDASYSSGRKLLDLIDLHIFDFLMGNQDRHHFESFGDFKNGAIIAIDNGRGFSRSYMDDLTILAPLYQCCKIRKSTFDKLETLRSSSVTLGDLLAKSLASDPLHRRSPLLNQKQLAGLDRRVRVVLEVLQRDCIDAKHLSRSSVIINDGF